MFLIRCSSPRGNLETIESVRRRLPISFSSVCSLKCYLRARYFMQEFMIAHLVIQRAWKKKCVGSESFIIGRSENDESSSNEYINVSRWTRSLPRFYKNFSKIFYKT